MRPVVVGLIVPLIVGVTNAPPERAAVFTGRVTNGASGSAISGAQVSLRNSTLGTVTDDSGRYVLSVPSASRGTRVELVARRLGFAPASRTVEVTADTVTVDFVLSAVAMQLQELVVTGVPMDAARVRGSVAGALRGVDVAGTGSRAVITGSVVTGSGYRVADSVWNTESYDRITENPFLSAGSNPLSTFSIDVDRASYSNVRRFITQGLRPPKDAVRIEEMINYFAYDAPAPGRGEPFAVVTDVAQAPWQPEHRLVRIALHAPRIDTRELPPSNIVFLLDVSGSMQAPNKLPLVKQSMQLLVDQLRRQDRVAIVVYAGSAGLVLPSTSGAERGRILDAIQRLEAGGSTAGGQGLRLAYKVAREHHIRGGNNRVILATDGDFNVGASSDAEMVRLVEEHRAQGTFLTVLGYGMGNYKDSKLEKLSNAGNGNYAYVDDLMEARKTLVSEFGGTLFTVAKDVKLQVEFNPARVAAYRLIGYENRLLRNEDFDDDAKDAGEIGAGHSVTALYEVIPVGASTATSVRAVGDLRYQQNTVRRGAGTSTELAHVKIRYKAPDGDTSRLLERAVVDRSGAPSDDLGFAASVAAFGMILRDSEHKGRATLDDVLRMAERHRGEDREGYRAEFIRMVERYSRLEVAEARR